MQCQREATRTSGYERTHSVVARKSSRYIRACGLKLIVSMYSYAPLIRSGSARPRSVFSADITEGRDSVWVHVLRLDPLTIVRRREVILQHGVDNCLDISRLWVTSAIVYFCLASKLVRCMTRLEDVQCSTHIPLGQLEQRLLSLWSELYPVGG